MSYATYIKLKVDMKRIFFSYERASELRKIAVYRSLISYLVPELQSFKDPKIKAKTADMKNESESIEIVQICDVTYIKLLVDLMNN